MRLPGARSKAGWSSRWRTKRHQRGCSVRPGRSRWAEPGRLLARLGQRKEVEILGLHLTEDGRRDLLASMEVGEGTPPVGRVTGSHEAAAGELEQVDDKDSHGEPAAPVPA